MGKNSVEKLNGLVIVTGASSGIGFELARRAARDGVDLILVADRDLAEAERAAREAGARSVEQVEADLASRDGVQALLETVGSRKVDGLIANAGQGEGGAFLDQAWSDIAATLHTNVTGTVYLIREIGQRMRDADHGRILVTGSIAGHMPGPFNLVYNATKSFMDFFCVGLANELKDSAVTVTCLLPGATDTEFFARGDLENTNLGEQDKADPAKVAEDGYAAMLDGETQVVSGWMNKLQVMFADILPDNLVAELHRKMAEPKQPEHAS